MVTIDSVYTLDPQSRARIASLLRLIDESPACTSLQTEKSLAPCAVAMSWTKPANVPEHADLIFVAEECRKFSTTEPPVVINVYWGVRRSGHSALDEAAAIVDLSVRAISIASHLQQHRGELGFTWLVAGSPKEYTQTEHVTRYTSEFQVGW